MANLKEKYLEIEKYVLCFVRKWWRPMTYVTLITGTIVNAIAIPLINKEGIDLAAFAAVIAAWSPMIFVREWGKAKGVDVENG